HTPGNVNTSGTINVTYPDSLVAAVDDILPSATLPDLNATFASTMDLPWMVHVGAIIRPTPQLEISAYYRWENVSSQPFWSVEIVEATSEAINDTLKPQGYMDRHFAQLRVGYAPRSDIEISVLGSFQSNTVPELTASPNTMDFNRIEVGLVALWRVSERIGLLAQYTHLFLPTRTIRQSLHQPLTDPDFATYNHPTPTGTYAGSSDAIRLSLLVYFDREGEAAEPMPEPIPENADEAPAGQAPASDVGGEGADAAGAEAWWSSGD
ncbi:MAG: hypothetical protein AB8H86_17540, partial [Polyangiales bacterium]